MKAVRVHGPGDVRLDEVEAPVAGERDVVVRVAAAGICGSDVTYVRTGGVAAPATEPFGLGHELAGTVETVGAAVQGIRPGDRVIVNPMGDGNAIGAGVPEGAFAPRLLVRDATLGGAIHRIPDDLSFDRAALAEPLSVSLHAVNRSEAKPGDRVVLFGAGPIGLGILIFLKQRGITDIAVVDTTDHRLDRARRLGATLTVNPDRQDLREALGVAFGMGELFGWPVVNATHWFEVTGSAAVVDSIVALAPFHARMVLVAVHHDPVPVNFQMALGKEMTIVTSMAYPDEFPDVIAAIEGGVDLSPMISHVLPFADFEAAFATAQDRHVSAKVLVTFDD
ncbi:zinc-dependent alcohol dehydrogenase [Edaphosphingomonas haloaromaticamans]|uniref:Sorbitol dehydrogenase n=1 Tax=Edaphosphingomonas haloaromaticamans TaxID=653954 RepID=A0A1S1HIV7_9SPHN|nr:alcohol dehydrogenase catalytic domain-containing protein [Sphingomonas haloaromaticamans]OHT22229.1 Sorbitol dehydrogenase [Sphingomonas haloaromaticamans]